MVSAGFMAGFGTTLSQLIEDDRKYYRDAAAKRRDYIQTYGTRAVVDREDKANAAMGTINYLISNGIEEDDVRYVLDTSGVQGIAQLKATLDSRDDLTATEKANLVKKAKDYVAENPDQDLNSIVKRAYGLYQSSDNPVKRERSMFASMLGLDSRMMEDDVLDDMYINGYTGRDIYRIMGSSGPKPGGPLDLDLPAKPPSPTILNNTAKFLESQFETSIDTRIANVRQQMTKVDPQSTDYTDLVAEQNKLETLKGKGLLALGEYAAAYDPALFDFARAQEEALPGSITRNSYLFEFLPAFKTHFEEGADDRKLDEQTGAALGGGEEKASVTPPPSGAQPDKPTTVIHKAADESEAMELLQSGNVNVGDSIDINGTIRPVTKLPEGVKPKATTEPNYADRMGVEPVIKTASRLLDGKDGKLESYNELYSTMMELPEEQRSEYASMFMQLEDNPDLADAWNVIQEEAPGATDWAAGKAFGGAKWALGAFSEGLARAYSYITGDSATAAEQVLRSRENREKAKEIMADGIVQYLQDVANEAGVKGNLDPARAKMVKDRLTKGSTLDTAIQKIVEPARAIGTVGFQDLGLREDVRDDPEVVEELRKAGLVMPVPDDSMDAKARRGTGRTAMIEPVRPESTPDPLKSAQTLARLRRTNPEYFIDTPPAVTDGDTASEVAAQARTGGDRAPGLMSRMTPNKPVDIEAEAAPKVGESEFLPLMKRVHGPQSDVVERFSDKVASGKITVADITRLIKSTQGLPETKSRDTLLASLYEYRDVMNKR